MYMAANNRSITATAQLIVESNLLHVRVDEYWLNIFGHPGGNRVYRNSPQGVQTGDSKHREAVESMAMSAEYHLVPYVRILLHQELAAWRWHIQNLEQWLSAGA